MRNFRLLTMVAVLLAGASSLLPAQSADTARIRVYPSWGGGQGPLYPGHNVLTISSANGLREVRIRSADSRHITGIEGDGALAGCPRTHDVRVFLNTATVSDSVVIDVLDCAGRRLRQVQRLNIPWSLDRNNFGIVEAGLRRCRKFSIRIDAGDGDGLTLDSIVASDPEVSLILPGELPLRIPAGETYQYDVCFTSDVPGTYVFPVTTWMRRDFPNGGYTTYPVADTGLIRVVAPSESEAPPPRPSSDEARPSDPTVFRSVAVPNAVMPPAGSIIAGVYDLLGLMAGYAVTDNVLLFGGGAVPTPDDWAGVRGDMTAAYSIGFKAGLSLSQRLDIAAGYQWANSIFDRQATPDVVESKIRLHVPFVALSYGDDDSRASITAGYALKHHRIPTGEFDTTAALVAIGGDRRVGGHWKVAAELAWMQTVDVVPVVATVRYFTDWWALDLGVAYLGITTNAAAAPPVPIAPVVSFVLRR